jgi:RpiR family carbohydrate utilization transcriptional regulator
VVISNSGRSRDLLDSTEIAKKKGATTIVITASGSPLSKIAQIHIAADHPEGYDVYSPMVSRLLHLLIIDVLTTGVAMQIGSKLRPVLSEMKRNLKKKRYRTAG